VDAPQVLEVLRALYRMKKDTVRLQDRADADRLRRHFAVED